MPREKKSFQQLHVTDYEISGVAFRAWKDDSDKLIFVLDTTTDEYKPNVLLVLNAHDERKWDDVLTNDYGVNLEDVRPRVDNKYQKLDIEYTGLDVYAQLIDEYERGTDLTNIVADLIDFRDTAARRAAMARLATANDIIASAEDTIRRTERSITGLRERRRGLRTRLGTQKENIGREPTKQSASRILKTESQIDALDEKLTRAEKRIENARRRIDSATADADAARDLLARRRPDAMVKNDKPTEKIVAPAKRKAPSVKINITEPTVTTEETEIPHLPVPEYEYQSQPRDEKMSDSEEVKPLLDQDPEILDDEIAFKPVAFDDIKSGEPTGEPAPVVKEYTEPESDTFGEKSETVARPLAFSTADEDATPQDSYEEDITVTTETPVIDTIKTVQEPAVSDTDTTGRVSNNQYDNTETIRPATPVVNVAPTNNSYTRPISPITGNTPVRPVGTENGHSSLAYYLLLILLIALSVFTLWLYQQKNGGSVPFLNATTDGMVETPDEEQKDILIGFDDPEPPVAPVSITQPTVEPEPVVEPAPAPVVDEPIKIEYPNANILRAAEPEVPVVESEEDVLARKEPYDVAREDKPIYVPEPRVTNLTAPDVIFDDDVVSVPVIPTEYADEDEGAYYDDSMYYDNTGEYYEDAGMYYDESGAEYVNDAGGFVSDEYSDPQSQRRLDVYDGGQYSVVSTETTY